MKPIRRHAFSLIEAAIVLAIVGLVMGGLWVAASSVMLNNKVSKLAGDVTLMMDRLSAFKQQLTTSLDAGQSLTFMVNGKIAPEDWIVGSNLSFMGHWVTPYISAPGSGEDLALVFTFTDLKLCAAVANYFASRLPATGAVGQDANWHTYRLGTVDSDSNFIWVFYGQDQRNGAVVNCTGAEWLEVGLSF